MKRLILAAVAAAGIVTFTGQAQAQHVSRNNPYRAFNHTGVNYGAQQLERQSYRSGYRSGGIVGPVYRGVTAPIAGVAGVTNDRWGYRSAYGWGGRPMYSGGYYSGGAAGYCW